MDTDGIVLLLSALLVHVDLLHLSPAEGGGEGVCVLVALHKLSLSQKYIFTEISTRHP